NVFARDRLHWHADHSGRFLVLSLCRARFPLGAGQRSALVPEAAAFRLGSGLQLIFMLLRSSARNGVISARPQVDEYVLDVAHDVRIRAERRHDVPNAGMTLSCAVLTFLRPLTTTFAKSG